MKYKDYKELPVWNDAHKFVLRIYEETIKFPSEEKYVLTSQIRRAVLSIPANIAEGFYRRTTKDLIKFLYNSRGSCGEVNYYLILARDLGFFNQKTYGELSKVSESILIQLSSWISSLEKSKYKRK